MKQSISYIAVLGIGVTELGNYYWNGREFITTCVVKFKEENIPAQLKSAKDYCDSNYLPWVGESLTVN